MRSLPLGGGLVGVLVLFGAGCPATTGTKKAAAPSPAPKVDAFTESSPVSALAMDAKDLWVGTPSGLERFALDSGELQSIGHAEGLPGERIDALAASDGKLWVLSDGGAASLEDGAWRLAPPAPGILSSNPARTALADEKGVWVGSSAGLFRLEADGWTTTRVESSVTHLLRGKDGALWIGTAGRGVLRLPAGGVLAAKAEPTRFGHSDGNDVMTVRGLALGPNGEIFVVGRAVEGDRVAVYDGTKFTSFRPSPAFELRGIARLGTQVALLGTERAYVIGRRPGARQLKRDGVQLVPTTPGAAEVWHRLEVSALDVRLPAQVRAMADGDAGIVLGTSNTGSLRITPDLHTRAYRARKLLQDALGLFIACSDAADCYVATGGRALWHFDGEIFSPETVDLNLPDARVRAVLRSPTHRVLAIYQGSDLRTLNVSERHGDHWEALSELKIEVPSGQAVLSFAHFAPDGLLWLGLAYRNKDGDEPTGYGVAIVDLSLNAVAYHHQAAGGARSPGVLPVPNDVADVGFIGDDEVWLATGAGATRLAGSPPKVRTYTEEDGLESEILHGIATTEGGIVFVASRRGVGRFDGETWKFPKALAVAARAIARGPDGRLWMGTDKGVVAYDGRRSELINRRRGLLEDDVLDLVVDNFGRVWARTAGALHVITPAKR